MRGAERRSQYLLDFLRTFFFTLRLAIMSFRRNSVLGMGRVLLAGVAMEAQSLLSGVGLSPMSPKLPALNKFDGRTPRDQGHQVPSSFSPLRSSSERRVLRMMSDKPDPRLRVSLEVMKTMPEWRSRPGEAIFLHTTPEPPVCPLPVCCCSSERSML